MVLYRNVRIGLIVSTAPGEDRTKSWETKDLSGNLSDGDQNVGRNVVGCGESCSARRFNTAFHSQMMEKCRRISSLFEMPFTHSLYQLMSC